MKNEELTIIQQKAAYYVVSGMTFAKIADKLGISERTIFRWMRLTEMQTQIRELRRITIEHSANKLMRLNDAAIRTLEDLLTCNNPASRCRAALGILTKTQESIDFYEFESRLKKIEQNFEK